MLLLLLVLVMMMGSWRLNDAVHCRLLPQPALMIVRMRTPVKSGTGPLLVHHGARMPTFGRRLMWPDPARTTVGPVNRRPLVAVEVDGILAMSTRRKHNDAGKRISNASSNRRLTTN